MEISVIIPTYNRSHLLARALDSVLAQTLTPVEIIVVDDGSNDDTQQLLKQYPHITLISQKNAGVSAARNVGIKHASSHWLAFLDSDDAWHPHKLAKQAALIRHYPPTRVCHTEEIWIRHGVRVNPMKKHAKLGGWIFEHCLPLCAISPSSILLHQQVLTQIGCFDESLPACEDYDLWLRITAHYPVLFVSEALTIKYGGHADQLSQKYWGMDRFRIQALCNMLKAGKLAHHHQLAAKAMLAKKINIYLQGAKKRHKLEEVSYYEKLREQYI